MFDAYLSLEVQDYINQKSTELLEKVAFQKNPFPDLDKIFLLQQIEGKQKAKHKLPTWFHASQILYPSKLSIEQTSSETTGVYKASLINSGTLCDLSGGFGVDSFYFSKNCQSVVHCEIQPDLSAIVAHNNIILNAKNIVCKTGNSTDILNEYEYFDTIYIDPARRSATQKKIFLLEDCEPNVIALLNFYFAKANTLIIKTSPLLDISAGILALQGVAEIHIVAVQNEVKELLWVLKKDQLNPVKIVAKNFKSDNIETFAFVKGHENYPINYQLPKKYIYEPNAAVMKSNGFEALANQYQLAKLHPHSHLFTSELLQGFCGRVFEVLQAIPYQKNVIKQYLENQKMHVTTRNFPETVAFIRKKWNLNSGGDLYSFFTTNIEGEKIVLLCKKTS
jgi:hypothetical protein